MNKRLKMTGLLAACFAATAMAGPLGEGNGATAQVHDDEDELFSLSSQSHPGGWNFDIVGVRVNTGPSPCDDSGHHHLPRFAVFSGWGFGVTGALDVPQSPGMNMMRSFNFCIEDLLAFRIPVARRGDFSVGMGIDLRNYRMTGTNRFVMNYPSQAITVGGYPEGSVPGTSRLRTFSTTYNLKYVHYLGAGFRIALGPELTVVRKPGKKHEMRTTYTAEDGPHKERIRGIHTNKVGFNLVGIVSYKNRFGFYTKYSPTSVLENGYGPQFQSITAGIMILGL